MKIEELKQVVKNVSVYVFYLTLIGVGFYIGSTWKELSTKPTHKPKSFTKKEISIAINEEKQLMLINKVSGEYVVYSDSIGMCIFSMYANSLTQKITKDKVNVKN
jgi:hypothetical protein